MKKKIISLLLVTMLASFVFGCGNKQIFDTTYTFHRAIIELPNGHVIDGDVESWTDYEDGDQIQVKINGKVYLVHSSNIVLINE